MTKIVIYDFDGTLTKDPLPKLAILEKIGLMGGISNSQYMNLVRENIKRDNIELYHAFYYTIFECLKNANYVINDENLSLGVENITYNPGVIEFLNFLEEKKVKNYILSSGIKVYLEKTAISSIVDGIYACTFQYNSNKEITGLEDIVSDKKKVDKIKEINCLNGKNEMDCSDVIYIGDGLTDMYAMEFVKQNGGTSIFVYTDEDSKAIDAAKEKNVVDYFFAADYTEKSPLYQTILDIIK